MDQDNSNSTQWTPQTIRENVGNWSLAGDAGLLLYLQNFSQKLTLRTRETITNVDNLFTSLDDTKIALANVTNDFINLHHTQFIESRVYEEDETISETKTDSIKQVNETEQSAENVELMRKVIQDGLDIMNKHFERVEVPNSDSEDESEGPSIIIRPKELYSNRPLPYVIGSDEWNASDHVGLKRSDESSESSTDDDDEQIESDNSIAKVHETTSESSFDMLSRDDKDLFNPVHKDLSHSNLTKQDNMFESSSGSSDVEQREKKPDDKFITELATKLGNVVQDNKKLLRDDDVYGVPQKSVKEPVKPSKSYHDGGLFVEEPPPLDEVDKTNLFGVTMGQNKYLASGGGLFDDIDNDEDSLWSRNRNTKEITTKSNDEEYKNISEETVPKDEDVITTKRTDEIRSISKGLFDDDSDIDDLFMPVKKTSKSIFPETKTSNIVPFIDDQPPPTDNTVTAKRKPPIGDVLKASKQQHNPEDVDDSKPRSVEQKPKKYISLFSDDETTTETKKFESIFDDDDEDNSFDFLISKKLNNKIPNENNQTSEKIKDIKKTEIESSSVKKDLFVDDQIPDIPADLSKRDFDYSDDDSDIFQTNTKQIDNNQNSSLPFFSNEPPPLDNNNTILNKDMKRVDQQDSLQKNTINLFNDIDDDVFQQKFKENVENTPSKRKIIDLFGDTTLQENIFESVKKETDVVKQIPPSNISENKNDNVDNVRPEKPTVLPKPNSAVIKTESISAGNVKNLRQKLNNVFEQKESQNIANNNEIRGKISHNLNINVNALLPGSVRPKLNKNDSIEEKNASDIASPTILSPTTEKLPQITRSVSFDEPVDNVETLQSLTQERVRIPVKRRPSTRRARQQALRASMIEDDNDVNEDAAKTDEMKSDVDTNENSKKDDALNGNKDIETSNKIEDTEDKLENSRKQESINAIFETKNDNIFGNIKIETKKESVLNDFLQSDEVDLFEETRQKQAEKSTKNEENNNFTKETFSENIFVSTKTTEDHFKSTTTTNINEDLTDSIVSLKSNQSSNTLPSFLLDDNDDDDLFSNLGLRKDNRLAEKKKDDTKLIEKKTATVSLFDDDDDDDIFAAINKKNQSKKTSQSVDGDDDTSLFSTNKRTVNTSERVTSKHSTVIVDDDINLFKPSNTLKNTESLFDDNQRNSVIKKDSSKTLKPSLDVKISGSLFDDDDDDDDLFGTSKTKTLSKIKDSSEISTVEKQSGSRIKNVLSTKKVSLFDDDDDDTDLFGTSLQKDNKKKLQSSKTETTSSGKIIKPASQVVFEDPLMFGDN